MNKIVLQAQELQAKHAKAQQELGEITEEASSGGGAVKVTIDGQQKVRSVTISPEVTNAEDTEMLQDMVMTAVNEAIKKSQDLATSRLGSLTNGLKIPGL